MSHQVKKPIYLWTKLTDEEWAAFLRGETVMMEVSEGTEDAPLPQHDPVINALPGSMRTMLDDCSSRPRQRGGRHHAAKPTTVTGNDCEARCKSWRYFTRWRFLWPSTSITTKPHTGG